MTFVNLQYGDVGKDVADVERMFGVTIHQMEGLDVKNDLDENAALCTALDLVISAPTAASAIAGGCGTQTWILTGGHVWPALGADCYPWYTCNRVFAPDSYQDWPDLMEKTGRALAEFIKDRDRR
jgi:hypothetical protein